MSFITANNPAYPVNSEEYENLLDQEKERRLSYNKSLYEALGYSLDSVSSSSLEAPVPTSGKDLDYRTFNKKLFDQSENGEITPDEYKEKILEEFNQRERYHNDFFDFMHSDDQDQRFQEEGLINALKGVPDKRSDLSGDGTPFLEEGLLKALEGIPEKSQVSKNETPPDEALYYNDLEWEPINTDRLEQTQFSDWLHGNSDDKPNKMNCYEGVCYDLLSREKLDKEKLREGLTADFPGREKRPTVGRTYSDSLLSVLDPKDTRKTVSYDDVQSGKHNIPAGSVIFANDESPGDHVFMTRTGEGNPVRSLWSKNRGSGNFSRSWLKDVVDEFYKGKGMDGKETTLRYNTAFADPVLQQMR